MNGLNEICDILKSSKNIAVIGISRRPFSTSRNIADYLVSIGYNVVGVNPNKSFTDADGIRVYNNLKEIPFDIDIVNVFRRSEDIPELISDILEKKPKTVWLQQGIKNNEAVKPLEENGIVVIQDKCISVYSNYCG